ncbi:DUF6233 domain-containing protein [Streptomyces sp. IBSNAI002]|uniref:DUF6233 domain-containing protein n=1 Tax=Streptomyces sp. IBSNAI002 TaxID=3457500 RepID=UPI003FD215DE
MKEEGTGAAPRPAGCWRRASGRRPGRGAVHAVDCAEAPAGTPVLSLEQALDAALHPGTRLCSLCGAAAEVGPVLKGFDPGCGTEN